MSNWTHLTREQQIAQLEKSLNDPRASRIRRSEQAEGA